MTSIDFAEAQQRVLARQRQREAERHAALASRQREVAASPAARLPFPLGSLGAGTIAVWDQIKGRQGTQPAFRVGQLDAELLDEQLLDLLQGQVREGLKYFGAHLAQDWSAEVSLALRAVLFKLSIWDHNASYGADLQGLQYVDARHTGSDLKAPSRWQKVLYGLVSVGGRYAYSRWDDWRIDQQTARPRPSRHARILSRLSASLETSYAIASLVSFLAFLLTGRHRTLLDRVLRLRLAAAPTPARRARSYEHLNRQLLWHSLTEFLLFFLPLLGIARWGRWARRLRRKLAALARDPDDDAAAAADAATGEYAHLPERTCALCVQGLGAGAEVSGGAGAGGVVGSSLTDVTNPYEARPCGCVYCFVCLATRLDAEEGEGFNCLRCNALIKECRPWDGDVLEETEEEMANGHPLSPTSRMKRVGFVDELGDEHHNGGPPELDEAAVPDMES